jgi:hypothetical protein
VTRSARTATQGSILMTIPSLYYHCSTLIGAEGLSSAAMLGVPVLGGVLMAVQRRRNARARRDQS